MIVIHGPTGQQPAAHEPCLWDRIAPAPHVLWLESREAKPRGLFHIPSLTRSLGAAVFRPNPVLPFALALLWNRSPHH